MRPRYDGGSLLNLVASLAASRGASPRHAPLRGFPLEECERARNVVFCLIDGLGYRYLHEVGRDGALASHLAASLTSVFPSTTASAITTTFSGASPAEHGLTGWHCWFPEADVLAAPLPFRRRGDEVPLAELGIAPSRLLPASLFDALPVRTFVVTQARIVDSDFSRCMGGGAQRVGYEHLSELVDQVECAVRAGSERKYVYAYYPELDTVAHRHGIASSQAAKRFAAVDDAFAELLRRLAGTDTMLVLSADHGFIDTPPEAALLLEAHPELPQLLRRPLSGEPRVAFCHVQPGAIDEFVRRARAALGAHADVVPSADLIAQGWFGPGAAHPALPERVGDVALVMRGAATIKDWVPGEKPHRMIGNHGGASAEEMEIPLVVARLP